MYQQPPKSALLWYDLKNAVRRLKYRVWNKHLLLSWYKLWVRKDEFHRSLDLDGRALEVMTKKERQIYCKDLVKRREIAHYKDLKTELDQLLQKN